MAFTSAQHFMARNMMDCFGLLIVANEDVFFYIYISVVVAAIRI